MDQATHNKPRRPCTDREVRALLEAALRKLEEGLEVTHTHLSRRMP